MLLETHHIMCFFGGESPDGLTSEVETQCYDMKLMLLQCVVEKKGIPPFLVTDP